MSFETRTGKSFDVKVDNDDVSKLLWFGWHLNAYGYVVARDKRTPRTGPLYIQMHRYVMDAAPDEVIDHQFGDQLDNRKSKLRRADRQGNGHHRVVLGKKNKSGKIGVYYSSKRSKWIAQIKVGYRMKYLGGYDTFDEAVIVRQAAELEYCNGFNPEA